MRIWILSDLHIDQNSDVFDGDYDLGLHPECDAIVMAGDLSDGDFDPVPWLLKEFTDEERGKLLFIAGNHEAYGIGLPAVDAHVNHLAAETGIHNLNRRPTDIGYRRFIGVPLWTNFSTQLDKSHGSLGDFQHIPGLTPDAWRAKHQRDLAWLEEHLHEGDIVVTHHAPSFEGLATPMQHNIRLQSLASGYYTPLDELIKERKPALWIHGHTHITAEYDVGSTRVVSNALGRGRNHVFDAGYVVELDELTHNLRIV